LIQGKRILLFGGSGSLGTALITKYLPDNSITNYSRDEFKHWQMDQNYNIREKRLTNIIGNIRDKDRVAQVLLRQKPNIIIIAAALKHIERSEYSTEESIQTNLLGTQNILQCIEQLACQLDELETVLFVSTDKACSPVNVYGMCKALSEKMTIEKAKYVKNIRFLVTRYGNVLNSKGSIIPLLHLRGQDETCVRYVLTHPAMTRFAMTLEQSCDLIEYAINEGESGDTIVPKLPALRVADLFALFAEKYSMPIHLGKTRFGEKIDEMLINSTQSHLVEEHGEYYHIKAPHLSPEIRGPKLDTPFEYSSSDQIISKEQLRLFLERHSMI
jgi:FlaA1/EpsC-like NDP-sugar epimerase